MSGGAQKEQDVEAAAVERMKAEDADVNKPIWQILNLFRRWFMERAETKAGRIEALGMFTICLCRAAELKLTTRYVAWMDGTLNSRNVADFKAGLVRIMLVNVGGAFLRVLYSYLQSRLTWKWRFKLTDHVHSLYFKDKAYYFIGEGGGVGGDKMTDPDHRITSDLAQTAQTFSDCFSDILFSGTAGVFYSWNMFRLYGWKYAVAPYAYLAFAFVIVDVLAPVRKTWRRLEKQRWSAMSAYDDAQKRLMLQSEAVLALKGSDCEYTEIMHRYEEFKRRTSKLFVAHWKFGQINQFVTNHLLDTFVGFFVIAPSIWSPKFASIDTIDQMATVRADVGTQMVLFTSTMGAARVVLEMVRKLQMLVGQVERVTEMLDLLAKVHRDKKAAAAESIVSGDSIKFEDVTIITPKDVTLVEHLSFELRRGGSLLLTGHNGAGKSSIFRCLGGLWPIPHGTITKPAGAQMSMNSVIFYLPQRPYQVMGTLPEQMTYPDVSAAQNLSEERLGEILKRVDLSYLMERDGVLTKEINWEEELSLGEKQRLAIARLIHHKPQFAVLDECTSAVSSAMERTLYEICALYEITYVTISHRPALQAYHDQMLAIGDGKCGFTLTDIDRQVHAKRTFAMAAASVIDKPTEQSIAKHLEERSEPYKDMRDKSPVPEGPGTLRRLMRVWKLGRPDHMYLRMACHLTLAAISTYLDDYQFGNTGRMFGCLMRLDKPGFIRLTRNAVGVAALKSFVSENFHWVQREAVLNFSWTLTHSISPRYISTGMFHHIYSLDGRIKDASHRVVHDVKNIGFALDGIYNRGMLPFCRMVWFTFRIGNFLGWKIPVALGLYFASTVVVLKKAMPNYTQFYKKISKTNSRFTTTHTRVRTCAESIAFFAGDNREWSIIHTRFTEVMALEWTRNWLTFKFRVVEDIFKQRIPDMLQWIIVFLYGYWYGGTDEQMLADKGAKVNLGQVYLQSLQVQLFDCLGRLISLAEPWANMTGMLANISEVLEVMDELEKPGSVANPLVEGATSGQVTTNNELIRLERADIVTPGGSCFASDLSVTLRQNKGLMLTGPNATGKTSLVRTIAGLWPLHKGQLVRKAQGGDGTPTTSDIFVVPQRIHMVSGSLWDQVTYPLKFKPSERTVEKEAELQAVLDMVGVGYLIERWKDDTSYEEDPTAVLAAISHGTYCGCAVCKSAAGVGTRWEDVLSLGEQQRIGMARMFFHKPTVGIMDECTSAVSVDAEEQLYQSAHDAGITAVTVSQRLGLERFHSQELRFGCDNVHGWTIHEIAEPAGHEISDASGEVGPSLVGWHKARTN